MNFAQLAAPEIVAKTAAALKTKGYTVEIVENGIQALQLIKNSIPQGVSVMNGASVTLEQIGFVEFLKSGKHGWDNLHAKILAETDKIKQAALRKQTVLSDYYLGSVHALIESGEFIIASNTGSQLPEIVFTSANLIFVVSTKKIVLNFSEAMKRLEEYIVPLEDAHMKEKFGVPTQVNKIVFFKNENMRMGRKVHIILVQADLGF